MKKFSKTEAKEKVIEFFKEIGDKSPKEVKKIKKLAMSQSLPLKELKKKFCKKCYSPLKGKTRIKKGIKSIECKNCNYINRWKIKD
jgi:RNase P subunit RPR2